MTRFYVVGIDDVVTEERKVFIGKLRELKAGWWHWIGDMWLVADSSDEVDASKLRDMATDATASRKPDIVVLEVTPVTWAAFGPQTKDKDMFRWLNKHWNADK